MNELKIGVIGCGGIAGAHATRLSTLKEVKLTAFSDIDEKRAKDFANKYGGNVYTDWQKMLEKEELDIVYICLPPFAHTDEVMVAAERGIHIFIEKPIALNMDLAKRMVEAVEKHGVKSQVGYQCRFGLAIEKAHELIKEGEAGDVGLALGWYWCHFLHSLAWWRDKKRSGGQVVEQATHLYDALRYICGDVDKVYGEMDKRFWVDVPDLTIEDVSSLTVRFKSGALGAIASTTWGVPNQWWLRWLIATKNYTLESSDVNTLTLHTTEAPVKRQTISEERDLQLLEAQDLIQAVLKDKETRTPMVEGAKSLEFTLAAMKSMETGRPVKLPLK
ncbi:MAG: Gfo/Idh/MocA family oxidoreductase [Candidatus Bathyarchaeia archaeon]